jgi:ribosomal protein L24
MGSTYSVDFTWATVKIREGPLAGKSGRVSQVFNFTVYVNIPGYKEVSISQPTDIILSLSFWPQDYATYLSEVDLVSTLYSNSR